MRQPTYRTVIAIFSLLLVAEILLAAQTAPPQKPAPSLKAAVPEHPVALAADAPAATCLKCHSAVQKGKYVHSAMSMGCATCHSIETKDGVTHVTLVSPANTLCETCHALSTDQVLHGLYKEGLCVVCHSPHSSDYPNHTLASAQDICLGCHARARLKVNQKAKTVTTPWGKKLTLAEMKGWKYLNLNATLTGNHPVTGHPVAGPNLAADMPPVSCQSCHKDHASPYKNLLTAGPLKSMPDCATCGVCKQCHTSMF